MPEWLASFLTAGEPYFGVWFLISIVALIASFIGLIGNLKNYWDWRDELIDLHFALHKKDKKNKKH